ncbi:hypothetical protein ACPOL_0902 [Acidisarcina polymorpha]|uniref:Uncharacterized protein n=1 Tax=Acidisarcina polymorpha TaxID=2211140 RepID=A0A2Z5FTT5_9BACT|nr:hypothetical protein ACPOL_0902 [Acidisarcina polymorpha]
MAELPSIVPIAKPLVPARNLRRLTLVNEVFIFKLLGISFDVALAAA